MRAPFNTLFGRLFGVLLVAIVLAHALAFFWFHHYGQPPPPPPERFIEQPDGTMVPEGKERHRPWFGGPVVPLTFQFVSLIIAAWYGAKLLSRPIQRLSEAAERLSLDLDSPPLEESGPLEARQAASTFNLMQKRIREQVSQRARMLGAVSHDLRTPLSRLKLRLEQIEDTRLQGQMRQDLDDMIGMLDATLSYLHEQRTSETRHWLDVQALVESMSENAQDQGSDVQFAGTCAPLQVQPMALRSCLNNLIDNALRYAGSARIELTDSHEALVIRVIDHGPGIAADKREAVFEPFYRLEGSRNRNSGGVGLGMTISKEAAERLGGRLNLEETWWWTDGRDVVAQGLRPSTAPTLALIQPLQRLIFPTPLSLGRTPIRQQAVGHRQQGRADKQADKTKGNQTTEHAEQHNDQRQIAAPTDEVGLEHVVHAADDERAPYTEEHRVGVITFPGQPGRGRDPHQRRAHGDQAEQEGDDAQHQRARYAGDQEADQCQHRLGGGGADHAVDYPLYGASHQFDVVAGAFADQAFQ